MKEAAIDRQKWKEINQKLLTERQDFTWDGKVETIITDNR